LLLYTPPTFKSQLENLRELFLRNFTVWVQNLHQTGYGFPDGLAIASVEMRTHGKISVDDLREVVLAHLAQCLSEIINDEPVVVGEQLVPHLRNFPARKIEVKPIYGTSDQRFRLL
jgi:hypothetical protein